MLTTNTKRLMAAFFVAGGSVCAGPAALGQEADGVEPVDLFVEESSAASEAPQVAVDSGGVTITAKDTDITMVLRILSMQSKRNIIASKNVSGTVSANLYKVDFYDALDAILQPNGFGYVEKGNFIYVKTTEDIQAEEEANRVKVHKLVRLNYLSAADAAAYVSPLLSGDGSISVSADVTAGFQPSIGDGGANSSAHPDTLIIADYEENVESIVGLITELDVQPEQVLVESTILQIRLTDRTALGIDFAVYGDIDVEDITTPLGVVDNLISRNGAAGANSLNSGQGVATSAGNTISGQSGVKLGFLGSDASLFVRALDEVNDTNVLATPKLLILNRQKAEILVGERLGYLSTTVTDTSETQTVEFLDVGVQLTARPFISSDDRVRMELRASLSDGDTTRVVDGNVIPQETTQEVVTNVIMRNGQTIVLGGLFKEDTGTSRSQLPGIGSVPGIGLLGKGQDDTIERSEVVFLVKPTVMKDEALSAIGGELEDRGYASVGGARDQLLPWSRTKMTAAHMKKAREFVESGNQKKALWHTNLALHLDPTMIDAMKLRQQLSGEAIYYYNRSNLKDVIESVIDAEADLVAPEPAGEAADAALEDALSADADAEAQAQTADAEADAIEAALAEFPADEEAENPAAADAAEAETEASLVIEDIESIESIEDAEVEFVEATEQPESTESESTTEPTSVEVVEVEIEEQAWADQPAESGAEVEDASEFETLTEAPTEEFAEFPETVEAFEPVTPFEDEADGQVWEFEEFEFETQVTEVETEMDEAK